MEKTKENKIEQKIVTINIKSFHNDNLPYNVVGDTIKGLGSTYGKNRKIVKGITQEEEDRWLPKLIGDIKDPEYYKKKRLFWIELKEYVKYSTGITLDVSTDSEGEPINIRDYILWKRALESPNVAKNQDESKSRSSYWFYINDEEKNKNKKSKDIKAATKAMQLYSKHESNESTLDMLLWMFNENPGLLKDIEDKQNTLFDKVTTKSQLFIEYCEDSNLTTKAEIYSMLHNGVIRRSGDTYLYSDYTLGDTIEDAVAFYKNAKNSAILAQMKAELKRAKGNK